MDSTGFGPCKNGPSVGRLSQFRRGSGQNSEWSPVDETHEREKKNKKE